ncbi:PIN domain-containing protein [Peribacillus frigoritolerans]|uniref:PIN domain-containing protein n=1 Tax=Peribacillus frigoritolerans TaxID=450367 RepID=UPI0020BFB3F4|nr:PIN domain-containing protein [Peribacillus frigoritolerans]
MNEPTINVYLDTNIIVSDFFLTSATNQQLLRLSKHSHINLYVCNTVYKESFNKYKERISNAIEAFQNNKNILSRFGNQQIEAVIPDEESLLQNFRDRFIQLQAEYNLININYIEPENTLDHLVSSHMHKYPPFFDRGKSSLRDAIIWYTYFHEALKFPNHRHIFLTDNVKDFTSEDFWKQNKDKMIGFPVFPKLIEGSNISIDMYRSSNALFTLTDFDPVFQAIKEEEDLEELYEKLELIGSNITESEIMDFLTGHDSLEQINTRVNSYVQDLNPDDVNKELFMGGYVSSSGWDPSLEEIVQSDYEVLNETVMIFGSVYIDTYVEIYIYNPVHDSRDDKFEYLSETELTLELVFSFEVNLDKEYKNLEISEIYKHSGGEDLGRNYFGYEYPDEAE